MRFSLTLFLLTCVILVHSQTKNYNTEQEIWYGGVIQLKNGNTLTGMVNYNFVIDQVKYKNNDRPEQNFSPVSVAHFLLYDDGRKKKFHSLPTDLNFKGKRLNGKETYSFFQEVHRNGKYMVLTKHLVEMQNGGFGTLVQGVPGPSINLAKEKVTEFVYIADRNQRITSILGSTVILMEIRFYI